MPLDTKTTTIDEAIAELEDDREDLIDEIARIPPDERDADNIEYARKSNEASELERYLGGLEWARDKYGGDAEIELGGLTTAERAEVDDRVDDFKQTTITPTESTAAAESIFWVVKGTLAAPFFDAQDLAEHDDPFDYKNGQIGALPSQLTDWLEAEINELSTVGAREGNSFMQQVKAKTETYHGDSA